MTSSAKPEVHNVSQRWQRQTELWPHSTRTKIRWSSAVRLLRYARRQTNRHTQHNTSLAPTDWAM